MQMEDTDKLPKGKKPCLSLRELEKQVKTGLDMLVNIVDGQMTVCELVDRYLKTKTGVGQSTKQGYVTVQRLLAKEAFGKKTIRTVKTSDAKLFLIKLQQEDGKSYSSIHIIRGVLRPAFQMAVDDDILVKNPFGFQLAGVLVNDAVTREAITKDQMRKFLKFVHDDVVYCKYYEVVYILFHTGMRISEFCGLTLKDIDLEKRTVNIDHQLQRTADMRYIIETTKTDAGTRVLPITEDVAQMFQAIIEDRNAPKVEKAIDGYSGFLFYDDNGMPLVAMHWQHRFNHMVGRYNDIYRVQMPNITPHVCRHTYCSNMAKSGMNPKTLQYLMGHSDISVTMNVYTHIGFDDAEEELKRMEEFRKAQAEVEQKKEKAAAGQATQMKKITGKVTGVTGEPLIGANVLAVGGKQATITNLEGEFSLEVSDNSKLQVTYIGYLPQEVSTNGKTHFVIQLKEDSQLMDEVVVVGFGTQKKVNLTGAVTAVNIQETLGDRPITNVTAALQGVFRD